MNFRLQRPFWVALCLAAILSTGSAAEACIAARPYAPDQTVQGLTPDKIIASFRELVVEGVIVGTPTEAPPIAPTAGTGTYFGWSNSLRVEMRIDKVWKGKAPKVIQIRFNPPEAMCIHKPPLDQRIRIGLRQISDQEFFYDGIYDLPLDQPMIDGLLRDYRERSDALEAAANAGDHAARLAFGEHLFQNFEAHRALDLYETLVKQDAQDVEALLKLAIVRNWFGVEGEPAATLNQARHAGPATDEFSRRIARTYFEATGTFEPGRLDFSNFDASQGCRVVEANLDGVIFDGANLGGCVFNYASLRNASFKGADLHDTDFGYYGIVAAYDHAALAGAKYDCATKFRKDFDPAAAGMINVEGKCPATAIQQ
jgi:uncharacterized protein YjbI with pentapeptide repeats